MKPKAIGAWVDQKRAVEFLLSTQLADGGWGYLVGKTAGVEPTAACLAALRAAPEAREGCEKAIKWLMEQQHADGGWGMNAADEQSDWHTAWAMLALAGLPETTPALARARDWLLAVPVLLSKSDEMQTEMRKILSIDSSLRGWPWLPGQAGWVEPTTLTILALTAIHGVAGSMPRVDEAVQYLVDRRCVGGGWNFGSPVMLGAELPPQAQPTALALLALHYAAPTTIQPSDISVQGKQMESDGGALALAWGLTALGTLGHEDASLWRLLADLQQSDGSWNHNRYHTAIALLAERGRLWETK